MTTFPIDFPTSPLPAEAKMIPRSTVSISPPNFTAKIQKFVWPAQWWEIDLTYEPSGNPTAIAAMRAFLLRMNGIEGTCLYTPIRRAINLGSMSVTGSNPQVDGANQMTDALATKGWTASAQGVLLRGDYFVLGTGTQSRLYEVLDDVNADGDGKAPINCWPRVARSVPADNDNIYINPARGAFRLTAAPELTTRAPFLEPFAIGLSEDLLQA